MILILQGDQIAFGKSLSICGEDFDRAVAEHLQMPVQAAGDLRFARIAASTPGLEAGEAGNRAQDPATDRAVYEAVRPLINDLVKEVTLCLRYYGVTFRGQPPQCIILSGGDSLEPRLGEVMGHACKMPVLLDDADHTIDTIMPQVRSALNRAPGPAPTWVVAAGLSMRGIGSRRYKQKMAAQGAAAAPAQPVGGPAA